MGSLDGRSRLVHACISAFLTPVPRRSPWESHRSVGIGALAATLQEKTKAKKTRRVTATLPTRCSVGGACMVACITAQSPSTCEPVWANSRSTPVRSSPQSRRAGGRQADGGSGVAAAASEETRQCCCVFSFRLPTPTFFQLSAGVTKCQICLTCERGEIKTTMEDTSCNTCRAVSLFLSCLAALCRGKQTLLLPLLPTGVQGWCFLAAWEALAKPSEMETAEKTRGEGRVIKQQVGRQERSPVPQLHQD